MTPTVTTKNVTEVTKGTTKNVTESILHSTCTCRSIAGIFFVAVSALLSITMQCDVLDAVSPKNGEDAERRTDESEAEHR